MENLVDISALSIEALQEAYTKLRQRYLYVLETKEEDAQRIHELKRHLDTATAAEAYLAQELEQLAASSVPDRNTPSKLELKVEDLRTKNNELSAENSSLQQDCELLQAENAELRKKLNELTANRPETNEESFIAEQQLKREQQLEQENLELLENLESLKENVVGYTMAIAERERNIEVLHDQVKCLEENMRCKRDELEEVTSLLESTQEQLTEANARIAMLTSAPESNNAKGNSLFAEVDDQRQAMKQLLAAQKQSYMQMKKAYNESEYEIRRLKRENIAIHTELQACSSIFCNADKTYQERLIKRMRQLMDEKDDLEKKLNSTQESLREVATEKGVLWLDSMLSFCKQETAELKKQLHSVRIQKASLEEQLRNSQKEMARWRFESLKSRCVIMDRENRLTENKIDFKPISQMEIRIPRQQLDSAQPCITNTSPSSNKFPSQSRKSCEKLSISGVDPDCIKPFNMPTRLEAPADDHSSVKYHPEGHDIENTAHTEDKENTNTKCEDNTVVDSQTETSKPAQEFHEPPEHQVSPLREIPTNSEQSSSYVKATKSILCKEQSLLPKETTKSVKFASNECGKFNVSSNAADVHTVKQKRTKSNIIIRKVVLNAKRDS